MVQSPVIKNGDKFGVSTLSISPLIRYDCSDTSSKSIIAPSLAIGTVKTLVVPLLINVPEIILLSSTHATLA